MKSPEYTRGEIERREGRVTKHEYRAVVWVGGRRAEGAWQYTSKAARADVAALRRSLLPTPEESERIMSAESHRRMAAIRTQLDTDRRVGLIP